jgi:sarcosine oxidase subunit beta
LRLPIRTHPLQAFVTNSYARTFPNIISDTEMNSYISQTARGQMLIGHEYEPQASYSLQSSFQFLQQCSRKMAMVLPFTRDLRILRQWTGRCDVSADFSPIIGHTGVDGFYITTGWGTWGFKAIPAGGEQLAQLIATGRVPELIAPFALDRFAKDQPMADLGSTGTK